MEELQNFLHDRLHTIPESPPQKLVDAYKSIQGRIQDRMKPRIGLEAWAEKLIEQGEYHLYVDH
jgi:hypothetical protein